MYLLDDSPQLSFIDPVIIAANVLALAALAFALFDRRRLRLHPWRGPAYQVFRQDVVVAALSWGAAQLAFGAAWWLRVGGLRPPIWSYLTLLVGIAIAALAWRRERARWPALAKTDGVELLPDGRIQRGTSQTWEMGMLLAGGLALLSYLATAGHSYPHPIHWLTTLLSFPVGYGLGLVIWTPRFKLISVCAKRHDDARARADRKHPADRRNEEAR